MAAQRDEFHLSRGALTRELSASKLLKRSLREHPGPWFAGALGSAAFLGLLVRRPSAKNKQRGPIGLLFGLGFALAKPALIKWGVDYFKREFDQRLSSPRVNSKLGERY
ncbi:hypothetical protein N9139_01440 [Akkermansiaceae bacterium]|nr:hypothetical protein [Akkermansiaceae bacterium]